MTTNPTPVPQPAQVEEWLDACERELVHPATVEDRLRRSGWAPGAVAAAVLSYRKRFNEHTLGYSALLVTTGLVALAAGSVGHVLIAGLTRPVNRKALAAWLTILTCSLPFAAWGHTWAARTDREDPVAAWSEPRRTLSKVLLWACGIVGIGRLVIYVGQLMAVLVHAVPSAPPGAAAVSALQVLVVVAISGPLGVWAFDFGHRFDGEDPSVPASHRVRGTVRTGR